MEQPEQDPSHRDLLQRLRREVERQISDYVYEVHPSAIGTPLSNDQIHAYLDSMRRCLVEPKWEEVHIRNTPEEIRTGLGNKRMCVTLAEENGYVLVYDRAEDEYHLAWRSDKELATWGVRGDAVGCFIAR
jgi:hypothetical protein